MDSNKAGGMSMNKQDVKHMSYMELWGIKRQLGFLYHIMKTGFYTLVLLMFFRVCVNIATGDLHFTTVDGLILIIPAIGITTVIWLMNEYFYKRKH